MEIGRTGRKNPGGNIGTKRIMKKGIDPRGNPSGDQTRHTRATIPKNMKRGKEQEAQHQEDMRDMRRETIAPIMSKRREEEEEEEEVTVQMREAEGDTPATLDEDTAQGP